MQDLKAVAAKKAKNIKALLNEVEKSLEYYEAFDAPHWGHIGDLNRIEASLKQLLDNE